MGIAYGLHRLHGPMIGGLLGIYIGSMYEFEVHGTRVFMRALTCGVFTGCLGEAFVFGSGHGLGGVQFFTGSLATLGIVFFAVVLVSSSLTDDVPKELLLSFLDIIKVRRRKELTPAKRQLMTDGPADERFLWFCYRADYAKDHFINEAIEKEDLRDLRNSICHKMDTDVTTLKAKISETMEKHRNVGDTIAHRVTSLEDKLMCTIKGIEDTMNGQLDEVLKLFES